MVHEGKLAYPGDSRWGQVSRERTRAKSMKQIRILLSDPKAAEFTSSIAALSKPAKNTFMMRLRCLSEQQFSMMLSRLESLTPSKLAFGIQVFAGLEPNICTDEWYPDLPKATRKQRPEIDTGPEETSKEWAMLQGRVHALPLELFYQIRELTLDGAFLPDIFPCQSAGEVGTNRSYIGEDVNLKALGLIDQETRKRYAHRVWVENLWVMGPIHVMQHYYPYNSNAWQNIGSRHKNKIRRVHLQFCREDLRSFEQHAWQVWNRHNEDSELDVWRRFMEVEPDNLSSSIVEGIANDLISIWRLKPTLVSGLKLQELTLDFNHAQGIDGSFLGIRLAESFPAFAFNVTTKALFIEAPTVTLADSIRDIIIEDNPGLVRPESEDTERVNAMFQDTESEDTESEDAGAEDVGAEDAGAEDAGAEDAGAEDAGAEDVESEDAGSEVAHSEDADLENVETEDRE